MWRLAFHRSEFNGTKFHLVEKLISYGETVVAGMQQDKPVV